MDALTDTSLAKFQQQGSAQIHPVILSGGAGTRLWPLSRAAYPKQLLPLVSERTLLQETAARNLSDVGFAAPLLICNEEHRFLVDEQLRQVGIEPQAILLEPLARNTGPAIGAAALWLLARTSPPSASTLRRTIQSPRPECGGLPASVGWLGRDEK
jgi:mannose-1-phosphate guanylyltransferase